MDYFTKWMEAKLLATITETQVRKFVKKNIIIGFRVLLVLFTDNGCQFNNIRSRDFCNKFRIEHQFTSVGHPQTNGEAKVTNRTILHGLKAWIRRTKQAWVDELDNILWAYRTMHRIPIIEMPFNLAYGTEAVFP